MCNHCLPGTNHPAAQSSRNARRLAKRARKTKGRNERMGGGMPTQRPAAAAATSQQPPRTITFPQESELEEPCPHCHTDGCDPDFCPERPRPQEEGEIIPMYMIAVKLPGEPPQTKYSFAALTTTEVGELRSQMEGLQARGKVTQFWINQHMIYALRGAKDWLRDVIELAEAQAASAAVAVAAPAGTVH